MDHDISKMHLYNQILEADRKLDLCYLTSSSIKTYFANTSIGPLIFDKHIKD